MSASGKSTFFDILPEALTGSDCSIIRGRNQSEYLSKGRFPPPTPVKGEDESASWSSREPEKLIVDIPPQDDCSPTRVELDLVDPPGQIFRDEAKTREFAAKFTNCRGILILLNPFEDRANWLRLAQTVSQFIDELKQRSLRIAFAVSQADAIPWINRLRPKSARSWLQSIEGFNRVIPKEDQPDKRSYFFLSSVGWIHGLPNLISVDIPSRLPIGVDVGIEEWQEIPKFPELTVFPAPALSVAPTDAPSGGESGNVGGERGVDAGDETEESATVEVPAMGAGDSSQQHAQQNPMVGLLVSDHFGKVLDRGSRVFLDPGSIRSHAKFRESDLEAGETRVLPGRFKEEDLNPPVYYPWNLVPALRYIAGIK